ncbi:MAG: aminopeptidase P N-terminal domain-containing protein, partial [Bryobacteraceae bacterium]
AAHLSTSSFRGNIVKRLIFFFFVVLFSVSAFAQYTDHDALAHLGGPQEFARRRAELQKELKTGWTLLFARINEPEGNNYREDNDFYYFTGLQDQGAVLLMNNENGRTMVFEPAQQPRVVQVYGPNLLALNDAQRAELGYKAVMPVADLDLVLARFLGGANPPDLWVRLGFADKVDGARPEVAFDYAEQYAAPYGDPTPGDRSALKKLAERYPNAHLRDLTGAIDELRNIKTTSEIEVLRKNGKLSAEGLRRAIARAKPGMYQYQVAAEARYWFAMNGAQGIAYPAIVGSGLTANTWHYFQDRDKINAGEVVVFDFAADLDHETMDITRTFAINGKFTPEEAKWYAADLASQKATIALLKPGHTYEEAAAAGKKIFDDNGVGKQWYGYPGHFLGMATHDVGHPSGPVKAGQVVTVEPIIEVFEKHWHFRVEDTILVTDGGPEILSSGVPKEIGDVEKLVGSEAK